MQDCEDGDANACIALLIGHNGPQLDPANACGGIDANFVIDRSGSIDPDDELPLLKSGIMNFATLLGAGSQFSGTSFSGDATAITSGYVSATVFNDAVDDISSGGRTWTEGGIQTAMGNVGGASLNPKMMFIVTDGGPNSTQADQSQNLGLPMNWVNAANEAILAANSARTAGFIVRAVYAGDPDGSMPDSWSTQERIDFANAVLAGLGGGGFLSGTWEEITENLVELTGCNPSVVKANGAPGHTPGNEGGAFEYVDWKITIANDATSAKTTTVTDSNANQLISVTAIGSGGSCVPATGAGPWDCTVPARAGGVNGQLELTVRTVLNYDVCAGASGTNTAVLTGEIEATSNEAEFSIDANTGDSCLGSIVVHKELGGAIPNPPANWNFELTGGPTQTIASAGGTTTFSGLALGQTYAVSETNGLVAACSAESPAGSFITTSGLSTDPANVGASVNNIAVAAGTPTHVYFKNTPCPGTIKVEKSSDVELVDAGGNATWTVTVTVGGNPTTAAYSVTDTLPTGWTIRTAGVAAAAFLNCPANVGGTFIGTVQLSGCQLPAATGAGVYTITIPVTAPPANVIANCKVHTNTAAIEGSGSLLLGSPSASDDLEVENCALPDLRIQKSGNGPINVLSSAVFTITVTNDGPGQATGVSISDPLPANANWSTATANCSVDGAVGAQTLTCTVGTLGEGLSFIATVTGATTQVAPNSCGTLNNLLATVSGTNEDQAKLANNTATASILVRCPSLTITKDANPAGPVNAGAPMGFDLIISNASGDNSAPAGNVSVTDLLPLKTGVAWTTATPAGCVVDGVAPAQQTLNCSGLTIAVGGQVTVHVNGTTTAAGADLTCGEVTNGGATATVNGATTDPSNSDTVVVNCPDPEIAKSGASPINAGDNLSYNITVTPGGTGSQTVVLKDTPPAGVTWTVGGDYNNTDCNPDGATVPGGSEFTCTFSFAGGDSPAKTVTLTAASTPAQCGPSGLENTARIDPADGSADTNTSNNEASATIIVNCPSVTLDKQADAETVYAGEGIGFTITVANAGPGTAKGFSLTDPLPANGTNWTIQSQTGPAINCVITGASGSQSLRCPAATDVPNTVDLAPTGANPLVIHVTSPTDKTSCGLVENVARVTVTNQATAVEPATAETTVLCPDIEVTKVASGNGANSGTLTAGDTAEYTIVVKNVGEGKATSVTVTDNPLPGNLPWGNLLVIPATPTGCAIAASGDSSNPWRLDCTFTELAKDAEVEIKFSALTTKDHCGALNNAVVVGASNEPDAAPNDNVDDKNAASARIDVNCAEIAIIKTPDATPKNATDPIGFTITATNNGDGVARGVTMTDTLPGANSVPPILGLDWQIDAANSDAVCTIESGVLECTWPDLAKGESKKVHITSTTTRDTCGAVANTAGVTTSNDGSANSTGTVMVDCPNVSVLKTKAAGQADPVSAGGPISFQIVVSVGGSGTAYNVMLNDLLPQDTSNWQVTNDPAKPAACGQPIGLQFICNFGNVASGTSFTITLTGEAIGATGGVTCGPLRNNVRVSAGNEPVKFVDSGNQSAASIHVDCPAVSVAKVGTNTPINAGEQAQWKITVTNGGPGTATDVEVSDSLPTGLTWSENHADCSIDNGASPSPLLTCSGGAFASMAAAPAAGSSIEILVSAETTAANCTTLNNRAFATAGNDGISDDEPAESALVTLTINCPDIFVQKTAGPSPISAGATASFTVTVRNDETAGTGVAKGVVITDQLPNNGIAWSADKAECTINAAKLMTCNVGDLDPDESFVVNVTGVTSPAQCETLPNQASATATNEKETDEADNISQPVSVVVNCPDVVVSKTPDAGTVSAGDPAIFSIEVKNSGLGTAANVTLNDTLPAGFDWTAEPGEPTCEIESGILDCSWESLAPEATVTVTLTAPTSPEQCREIPNTAVVDASNESDTGPASDNNSNPGQITVLCPDIELSKEPDESPVDYGAAMSFTITVRNIGLGVAKDVVVTEDLPDGIVWASESDGCGIEDSTIVCRYEEIEAGGERTVVVTSATVPATCEPVVNRVSATASNEPDGARGVNSAEATINIRCGTIQIVKIDQVAGGVPADGDWDFTLSRDNEPFAFAPSSIVTSVVNGQGGGTIKLEKVPFGTYAASELEAIPGVCPRPNASPTYRTTGPAGPAVIDGDNLEVIFTFTNIDCGVVASIGVLEIHKVEDVNGNHIQDAGEPKLANWPMTITGPQFPLGTTISTDSEGKIILPGIFTGTYTVTEGARAGYVTVGVVADDNGPVFSVSTTATVNLGFEDTDIITFFNQPRGSIAVTKVAVVSHNGGPDQLSTGDDDGWVITLTSAACGINHQVVTGQDGKASFTNLPICSDYVVSENTVNADSPGFIPVGSGTVSNVTPGRTVPEQVTFTNRRSTQDPPCQDCVQQPTPTPSPTNTPVPTSTPTTPAEATSTPTPVSTTAGERTPGPGSPTPIAPSTGEALFDGAVGSGNVLLVLAGLAAIAGGLVVIGAARRQRGHR